MVKVQKIMSTDVPTLEKEATVEQAAKLLVLKNAGCVVIVEDKKPIGIVTELDFVRNIPSGVRKLTNPVGKIMASPVTFMTPNMSLDEALKIIDTKPFRKYPVVENGKLVGMVTKKDIVTQFSDNLRFHRNIQNTVLILFVLFEFFVFVASKYIFQKNI